MPSKINSMDSKPARITSGPGVRAVGSGSAGKGNDTPAGSSDVHLTGAARNLAAVEQSLRALPAIDELRVAAVRQRLHDGQYDIDPQRVADKLLRLDSDLSRATPVDAAKLG